MRPRTMRLKGLYVYRTYDAAGLPVYFGCSSRLTHRLQEHSRSASWWPLVATMRFTGPFTDRAGALSFEAKAIMREGPRFNEVHHPRRDLAPAQRRVRAVAS